MTAATTPSVARVSAATRATYVAFIGAGFAFASWAARIPQVRDRLQLDPSELGLVLLAVAAGSVIALPLSGPVVSRLGSRRTVAAMALLLAVGLVIAAVGYLVGVLPVVIGLFLLGFANGAWDVAMNVQGALVERHLGRSIMSRFHAGFSLGTVVGALTGAAMVALDVPVTAHLTAVAAAVAVTLPAAVRRFVPDRDDSADHTAATPDSAPDTGSATDTETPAGNGPASGTGPTAPTAPAGAAPTFGPVAPAAPFGPVGAAAPVGPVRPVGSLAAWTEPRTLLIGVFVLAFAFAEGVANDWISVAVIDGYQAPAAVGTLAFAVFLAAMMAGRWVGPGLLDRYGRVPVIRALTILAVVGLALFVFGPSTPVAFAGAVLWGAGVSLGFPVGMSAGADEPARAASRVSVIASIGYCAFLAGPPLIGFLGQRFTVLRALTAVAVLLGVAALVAGAVKPLPPTRSD